MNVGIFTNVGFNALASGPAMLLVLMSTHLCCRAVKLAHSRSGRSSKRSRFFAGAGIGGIALALIWPAVVVSSVSDYWSSDSVGYFLQAFHLFLPLVTGLIISSYSIWRIKSQSKGLPKSLAESSTWCRDFPDTVGMQLCLLGLLLLLAFSLMLKSLPAAGLRTFPSLLWTPGMLATAIAITLNETMLATAHHVWGTRRQVG
ncbi:MAG: hypothetical protein PHC51_12090 [bacterium]|nr:hypothetical protein [bacterium]